MAMAPPSCSIYNMRGDQSDALKVRKNKIQEISTVFLIYALTVELNFAIVIWLKHGP